MDAREILVITDIGDSSENFGEGTSPRPAESSLENLTMLLLGASTVLRSTALQLFHKIIWKISDDELSHWQSSKVIAMISFASALDKLAAQASRGGIS